MNLIIYLFSNISVTYPFQDGTVCDDNFGENSAAVICKEMGFACSVYWSPMVILVNCDYTFEVIFLLNFWDILC